MRKTTNHLPVIADEPGETRSQNLRINELPAQHAAKEQEDALRGGAVAGDRFTGVISDLFTYPSSDR